MSSLRTRLALGMVVPALVLALGAAYLLLSLRRIEDAVGRVRESEEAVRQSLLLASAAREQYNHVAHVLLLPAEVEGEHLHHFDHAVQAFADAARRLEAHIGGDELAARLFAAARAEAEGFQALFTDEILPAHRRGDREAALARHVDSERLLARLVRACDALSAHFREVTDATQAEAAAVSGRGRDVGIGVVLAAGAVAVLAAGWLWSSISAPLRALTEGMERLGQGQLDRAVEVRTHDELAQVAACLNDMAGRLRSREAALIKSERSAALGRLAAGVAHQLNNPLAVMLGYVKVLSDPRYDEARREEARSVLEDEVRECQATVRNLMELARPSAPVLEPCDVARHVTSVLERATRYRGAKEIAREVSVDEGLTVVTDCRKLEQALLNLVMNALEATPAAGTVRVRAAREGTEVRIDVADGGPGVPAADRGRIFDPYYTTKRAGTGLGLALASGIVKGLGGRLELVDGGPPGASFRIALPAEPPAAEGDA